MRRLAIAIALLLSSFDSAARSSPPRLLDTKHVILQCAPTLFEVQDLRWEGREALCRKMAASIENRLQGSRFLNGPVYRPDCETTPGCMRQPDILLISLWIRLPGRIDGLEMTGFFIGHSQVYERWLNPTPKLLELPLLDHVEHFGGSDPKTYLASPAFERLAFRQIDGPISELEFWARLPENRKQQQSSPR